MDVTGAGRVSLPGARALLRLTVESSQDLSNPLPSNSSASTQSVSALHSLLLLVTDRTAATATVVVDYLASSNLSSTVRQLHSSAVQVQPVYSYRDGQQIQRGYRASTSLSASVNASAAGWVLGGVLDRGVTRVDSVTYEATEEAIAKGRTEAIARAVRDALSQAEVAVGAMSRAKGVDLGERSLQLVSVGVVGVSVPPAFGFSPGGVETFGRGAGMARSFVVATLPLVPQDRLITASVVLKVRF